ncbi:MAG: cyclase family protein [Pseudomonadota bacterium]
MRWGTWAAGLAAIWLAGSAGAEEAWHPSRYGEKDTLGALNNLSAEGVLKAARLVKSGKVYALGVPTGPETPAFGDRVYKIEITPKPGEFPAPVGASKVTAHDEKITTSMGIGTQIDGLGHLGIDHRYYNGLTGAALNTPEGFNTLELSNLPPIVTRGVLIDMSRHFGGPMKAGQAFNRAEIEAAMKAQGVTIGKGDVVLFHTGWMDAKAVSDKDTYRNSEPGLGEEGATWLADQGVVAIGSDTIALEPIPFADPDRPFVVHQTLLAKKGVHVLEAINTGPLAADRVTEFLFVLGVPRFVGTVQTVINPVAIR